MWMNNTGCLQLEIITASFSMDYIIHSFGRDTVRFYSAGTSRPFGCPCSRTNMSTAALRMLTKQWHNGGCHKTSESSNFRPKRNIELPGQSPTQPHHSRVPLRSLAATFIILTTPLVLHLTPAAVSCFGIYATKGCNRQPPRLTFGNHRVYRQPSIHPQPHDDRSFMKYRSIKPCHELACVCVHQPQNMSIKPTTSTSTSTNRQGLDQAHCSGPMTCVEFIETQNFWVHQEPWLVAMSHNASVRAHREGVLDVTGVNWLTRDTWLTSLHSNHRIHHRISHLTLHNLRSILILLLSSPPLSIVDLSAS